MRYCPTLERHHASTSSNRQSYCLSTPLQARGCLLPRAQHFRHLQWEAYQTHFRNLTTTPPSDHPATPSYVTPIAAAQDCQSASRPIRNPGETHDSVDNLASMHTAAFLTRTSPAALQSLASQPQNTTLSGHQPCARQLERGEAKASENLDNAMHGRSCAPAILIITFNISSAWHGMANEHSTEEATYISRDKRAFVPKRPCHSRYGSRNSDAPHKVRHSNTNLFLFCSSPLSL